MPAQIMSLTPLPSNTEVSHEVIPRSLSLPTPEEQLAYQLRRRQGLNDSEIARTLGISRETANRRRGRFVRKVQAIRRACPNDRELLEKFTA